MGNGRLIFVPSGALHVMALLSCTLLCCSKNYGNDRVYNDAKLFGLYLKISEEQFNCFRI